MNFVLKKMSRRTADEMFPLMAEWESSDMTREDFCRLKAMSVATFSYWRTKYLRMNEDHIGNFTEIKPEVARPLSIIYPNGVRIEIPLDSGSLATIQTLLRLI